MQKRTISLISLILLIVFVVFSFMPVILMITSWERNFIVGYTADSSWMESFADFAYTGSFTGILVYVCYLFTFIGISVLILQSVGKQSKTVDLLTFTPVISAAIFILFSLLEFIPDEMPNSYSPYGYLGCSPGWGYYIEIALIIAVAFMSVLIATGKLNDIQTPITQTTNAIDGAVEILKYKQLLDEGIISQEEFDAKKKIVIEKELTKEKNMKYCQNCGAEVHENAVVCVKCGCAINNAKNTEIDDSVSVGLVILAVFVPLFGIIYWPVNASKRPNCAKACGIAAIISWVVSSLILLA